MKTEKHWREITVDGTCVLITAEVEGEEGKISYSVYLPSIASVSQTIAVGIDYDKAGENYNFVAEVMADDFPHEAEVRKFLRNILSFVKGREQ